MHVLKQEVSLTIKEPGRPLGILLSYDHQLQQMLELGISVQMRTLLILVSHAPLDEQAQNRLNQLLSLGELETNVNESQLHWLIQSTDPKVQRWSKAALQMLRACKMDKLVAIYPVRDFSFAVEGNQPKLEDLIRIFGPGLGGICSDDQVLERLRESVLASDPMPYDLQAKNQVRFSPLLRSRWNVSEQEFPSISDLLFSGDDTAILRRFPDYGAVMQGLLTHHYFPDPKNHIYQSISTERPVTIELSDSCGGVGFVGDLGRGSLPRVAVNAYICDDLGFEDQAPKDEVGLSPVKTTKVLLKLILEHAAMLNARGIPSLAGFVRDGMNIKAAGVYAEYGHIYPDSIEQRPSDQFAFAMISDHHSERSVQNVINRCCAHGPDNPIMDIRYTNNDALVLCLDQALFKTFETIARREQCGYVLLDAFDYLDVLPSVSEFNIVDTQNPWPEASPMADLDTIDIDSAVLKVLSDHCVADKRYIINHVDRSSTGYVIQDQMIGPWQIPVSDVAITVSRFSAYQGEAFAVGERAWLMEHDPLLAVEMAIAEAITNLMTVRVDHQFSIKLSFQVLAGSKPKDNTLWQMFEHAKKCADEIGCDIAAVHQGDHGYQEHDKNIFVVHAHALLQDYRARVSPRMRLNVGETQLLLVDLSGSTYGLSGSVLNHALDFQDGLPSVDMAKISHFIQAMEHIHSEVLIEAYHDRSDGGLMAALAEMMFASRAGLDIFLDNVGECPKRALFCENPGVVLQVKEENIESVMEVFLAHEIDCHRIGEVCGSGLDLKVSFDDALIWESSFASLHRHWSYPSYQFEQEMGNPLAKQAFETLLLEDDPGRFARLSFDVDENPVAAYLNQGVRPRIAILRQQESMGHVNLAAAFDLAGFDCVDIHMHDLIQGRMYLKDFQGLAICGTFSYNDVLGAGYAWAQTILHQAVLHDQFARFFSRSDTFVLGIANGAQMLSYLRNMIVGAELWPSFERNISNQFEARLVMVEVGDSNSMWLEGMAGSQLPVNIAHSYGRSVINTQQLEQLVHNKQLAMRYIDHHGESTAEYPYNPDGSEAGVCAFSAQGGRVLALMPHIERCFLAQQMAWHPHEWSHDAPWMRIFYNARAFVA